MATRRSRRHEWRRTKTGLWTCSLGHRGMRVRLFQKRRDGTFYRATWVRGPGAGRSQASLETTDRAVAEQRGKELLAALLRGRPTGVAGPVGLANLWHRYSRECPQFLDNKARTRRDDMTRAAMLIDFFGGDRDVRALAGPEWARYAAARRSGGIRYRRREGMHAGEEMVAKPVGMRVVQGDLVFLRTMLRWACTMPLPSGERLLNRNPLDGVRCEREKNPKRLVATWDRFTKTRDAAQALAREATSAEKCERWIRLELALVLAEATGRRLGSIRALRWDDIEMDVGIIRWRAHADKKGYEWEVPLPAALVDELSQFQRRLGTIGGLLFPADRDPTRPMATARFGRLLLEAERKALLPKLAGSLWHAYRRKWATERKGYSLKDVAAAGGWKGTQTLLECYQQPDVQTMRLVMEAPAKLRDPAPPPALGEGTRNGTTNSTT